MARVSSLAARPILLSALDTSKFRAELTKCCANIAKESADKLLSLLREEYQASEITSGFHAKKQPFAWDMSVEDGKRYSPFVAPSILCKYS